MATEKTENSFFGHTKVHHWIGVVEDRNDPLKLGRVRVRINGWHTENKADMPTDSLPWCSVIASIDSGTNSIGLREADWVVGMFIDGDSAQNGIVMGMLPGIPEDLANPEAGFSDPTVDVDSKPRHPEYKADDVSEDSESVDTSAFSNPKEVPGSTTPFGQLEKEYKKTGGKNFPFDVNADGKYDAEDARLIRDTDGDGKINDKDQALVNESSYAAFKVENTGYPLKDKLKEPTTSRLARNEKIERTIIAKKKSEIESAETASHESSGVGTDESCSTEPIAEPETPYKAVYPYNHVYESESGHYTEIDDTPKAERIHHYHRSGSFREYHTDGTIVDKAKHQKYDIVEDSKFTYAKKDIHETATEKYTTLGKFVNHVAKEDANLDAGKNRNRTIENDMNTKIGRDKNNLIERDELEIIERDVDTTIERSHYVQVKKDRKEIIDGDYYLEVAGNFKIKVGGTVYIEAGNIDFNAANISSHAGAHILIQAPAYSLQGHGCVDDLVATGAEFSAFAVALGGTAPIVTPPLPCPIIEPADVPDREVEPDEDVAKSSSSLKEGFILDGPFIGYLYKPVSDSNGNLVTLSKEVATHALYEAVPTGELETVDIQYLHADLSITTWTVVRPKHVRGRLIETGRFSAIANGGRAHYRFSKPGGKYPESMIWGVGDNVDNLILKSSIRHD